jgi:glutamate-ammonia-ligase adenylyltransferase
VLTDRAAPRPLPPAADFLDPAVPPPGCLAALGALGFADPAGALQNLRRLAETPDLRDQVAALLPRLLHHLGAAADPDMALNNLERLAAAALDRRAFYALLGGHPEAIPILLTLCATSQFLADALVRSPQIAPWLLDPRVMRSRSREEMDGEVAAACRPFRTEEARLAALRRVKRRELCRIGLRDILGDADLVTTTQELSELADACIAQARAIVEPALLARYGRPGHASPEGRSPTGFTVIALGKLGGSELNYSSDVDLCFAYEAEGETGGPEVVANRVYFARLAERLVAALTAMTEEGTVYRVDLRLRPEGTGGPLALPLGAYRQYHQTRGALWERQALIKARVAAGDERVGQAFLELARQQAYRAGLEREALGEVRAMKHRIDRQLRARGQQERHVKLGVGGIRDVEFHVQALQLLYGAQDPWLRERNTLRALHRLAERGYLSWEESGRLARAYTFLRTIEHRLQILHALQTHTLPADPLELGKLARRLGYAGDAETAGRQLVRDYDHTRRIVRTAFEGFFDAPVRGAAEAPPWEDAGLAAAGFADPERARQNLRLLWEGPPLAAAPAAVQAALRTLIPAALAVLRDVPDPDAALDALERFVTAAGPRTAYLARLAERPALLGGILTFFTRSERLRQALISRPELLDELADPARVAARRSARQLCRAFETFDAPGHDRADRLRLFKQAEEVKVAWRDVVAGQPAREVGAALGELAEACLALAWGDAEAEARAALGVPEAAGRPVPALVVGMGKLGGRELDYGSDLDLVVLYAGPSDAGPEAHVYFDRVVDRLSTRLSAITRTGQAFRIDLRLRQGGKATALAHDVASLERYLESEAALWERQALVKARPVLGDPGLARRFLALRRARVFGPGLSDAERAEIHRVRTRMELELGKEGPGRIHLKFGAGGLVDVEFLVQVLQLAHGARHPALRTPSTRGALERLGALGVLPPDTARELLAAYDFLRRLLRALRLRQARPPDCLPAAGDVLARLARELGLAGGRALLARHREVAERVRAEYRRVVGGVGGTT